MDYVTGTNEIYFQDQMGVMGRRIRIFSQLLQPYLQDLMEA